jgi:hypothetical protein
MAATVAVYAAYKVRLRRNVELGSIADVRDSRFDPSKDDSHDLRYAHFSIFTQGRARYAFNTVRCALDVEGESWPVQYGDYHFETLEPDGNQPKPLSHLLSYVLVETPYLGLPDLHIRCPEMFDKVAGLLGLEEINFESDQFNNRFAVQSRDKRFAYDVLHPRMMEFLLDRAPPMIDFSRGQCCLSLGERRWSVAEFDSVLVWAAKFFALWPRHVTTTVAERLEA